MLSTGLDAAHDGLVCLAGCGWLISPLLEEAHREHPAETAPPGRPRPGSGYGLVAVTFGALRAAPGYVGVLPVHWESVEPGDVLAVPLTGDLTLSPAAAPWGSNLSLAGSCQLVPAAETGFEQARLRVIKEAARSFITSVAVALARSAAPGQEPPPLGPAQSWVTGYRPSA